MGHSHNHHSHHTTTKNIKRAFFLNLAFTIIELIGGIFTNSLAILSDALHDLGDSLTLGLSWYFQKLSGKGSNEKFSYGYRRFSLLGAIVNSVVLIIGSIFIIKEAIPRIINPEQADAKGMMWIAILGVIVNGAAVVNLKKGKTINERVVMLHLLEDVLGWIAVLIASIVMQFWDIPILDPILSMLIAGFVLFNVYQNVSESLRILLQGTPKEINLEDIQQRLLTFEEIENVHDCHLWTMDGEYNILTLHIVLKNKAISIADNAEFKKKVRKILHDEFQLEHVTLEFELSEENCEYFDCD
ncbi:cation diffusion facilitator family transporter [Tenacibaculum crassostreae]|uniref:cation diffusion facilitator family transporter n=1 Tax=Tenacibaculum crassostreae TaxID=502683 RepID=UPI003894AE52